MNIWIFGILIAVSGNESRQKRDVNDPSDLFRGPRPDKIEVPTSECVHVPVQTECNCFDQSEPESCDHCFAIVVHLGCDIRSELAMMKESLVNLIESLHNGHIFPGTIKLSFLYFGNEHNIHIPLTFTDPLQNFEDIYMDVENVIKNIEPTLEANITATLESALTLFNDFEDTGMGNCKSKTIYFITNGHVQCGPCKCTEVLCPEFDQTEEECWKNTVKESNKQLGWLKLNHTDVNIIVATPNDRPCAAIIDDMESCDLHCKNQRSQWHIERCHSRCEFRRSRYSEDCFNATNTNNLIAWSSNSILDGMDSNLDCDNLADSKYDPEAASMLCNLNRRDCSNGINCLPDSLQRVSSIEHMVNTNNGDIVTYLTNIAQPCPSHISNTCECSFVMPVSSSPPNVQSGCCGPRGPTGGLGLPGYDGPSGPLGSPGSSGDSGTCGPRGINGETGQPGRPGQQGRRGNPGTSGSPGSQGIAGRKGDPGKLGPDGLPGVRGMVGFPGSSGTPGRSGAPGVAGLTGASGPAGTDGAPGTPGIGIESPAYFKEYKRQLQKLIEKDITDNGRNSKFYKKLVNIIRTEMSNVCKCGCNYQKDYSGECKAPEFPYFRRSPPAKSCSPNPPPTMRPITTRRTTPVTQRPTTQKSTTQKPTTQKPTTQKPTTQKPTTQKPVTVTDKPNTLPARETVQAIRIRKPIDLRQIYWRQASTNRQSDQGTQLSQYPIGRLRVISRKRRPTNHHGKDHRRRS